MDGEEIRVTKGVKGLFTPFIKERFNKNKLELTDVRCYIDNEDYIVIFESYFKGKTTEKFSFFEIEDMIKKNIEIIEGYKDKDKSSGRELVS